MLTRKMSIVEKVLIIAGVVVCFWSINNSAKKMEKSKKVVQDTVQVAD